MGNDEHAVGGSADPTAELVERAVAGDDRAFGALYDAWFDRVYDRAYGVVRDHSLAAEVAQDTFLRAWQQLATVRDPSVFGGWLLRIARNAALNRLRSERRTTAVDDEGLAMIERAGPSPANAPTGFRVEDRLHAADDPATAVEDEEIVALVADAAAALEGRDAEVLDLGLRLGLTPAEIGEAVGLNRNAANQAVHRARRRFRTAVEARVLWRRGRPDCPDLVAALAAAGVQRFGAAAVAVADAHAAGCERCREQRRLRLDPAVLFGAVPLVGAPPLCKAQIAHALAGDGVPMGGSAHAGGPGGADGSGGTGGTGSADGASGGQGPGGADGADGAPTSESAPGPVATTPIAAPPPSADPPEDPTPTTSRSGARLAVLVGVVVALLAVVVGGLVLAGSSDDGDPRAGTAPATRPADLVSPTTTTVAPTGPTTAPEPPGSESGSESGGESGSESGTGPGSGQPGTSPPATAVPGVATPPATVAPTDPPPPPPAITGSISVSPSSRSGGWSMSASDAPRLTWSSANAASVTVEGNGFSSTAPSGSVVVCPPGQTSGPACTTPPVGTYRYRLTLRDASGAVVLTRDALLTIGP